MSNTNGRTDALRDTTSRNAVEAGIASNECREALNIFNRDLAAFCRRLDIPPSWLTLRTPELLMLVCMRQQALIDTLRGDIDELSRLAATQEPRQCYT